MLQLSPTFVQPQAWRGRAAGTLLLATCCSPLRCSSLFTQACVAIALEPLCTCSLGRGVEERQGRDGQGDEEEAQAGCVLLAIIQERFCLCGRSEMLPNRPTLSR